MIRRRSFAQRVRIRMMATGESYLTARQALIAAGDTPGRAVPPAVGAASLHLHGGHARGRSVIATRTIRVPVDDVFQAIVDDEKRIIWAPAADVRLRTATAPRTARFDWVGGISRVTFTVAPTDEWTTVVTVEHAYLPDPDTADEMRAFWRTALGYLRHHLEWPIPG